MERPSPDELISAYFDGEATPEERALVERLLADPKHRQTLEEYGQLRDEIRSMPTPRLSSAWSSRLREKLAEAKPGWAAPAASPSRAASPGATAPPFSTDGKVEAPPVVPLASPASSGESSFRFRQLWLAAGVGVAAGTLGIVIGWSAQTLRPDGSSADVAVGERYETQSAAPAEPMATMASPENLALRDGEEATAIAKADVFGSESQDFRHRSGEALVQGGAEAPMADAPADYAENAGVAVYDDQGGKSALAERIVDDRLAELRQSELKKAEKQTEAFTGGAPAVQMRDETRDAVSGALAWGDDVDGIAVDGKHADFFATYVGVWERPVLDAYDASGGDPDLKFQAAGEGIGRESGAGDAANGQTAETPSLSLEGTPEKVAEALEILSRAETGGRVRLLTRVDDDGLSRAARLERLQELASAPPELSAEAASRLELESVDLPPEEREDGGSNGLADGLAVDKLAVAESARGIARIEAFFYAGDVGKDRQFADATAGKETFGAYGFGSGGAPGAGGFGGGGLGGGTFAESAQTERAEMDAARSFAAPATDAPRGNALADLSNGGFRGGAESLVPAPSASRAMQPATSPAPAPVTGPAPATALAESAPGLPLPAVSNAPPAGEPNSRSWNVAPAGNGEPAAGALGPRAPVIAGTPSPPEPAVPAAAEALAESESGAMRRAKANDETENAPADPAPRTLAQSEPADPEGAAPAEKPASDPATVEAMSLLSQNQQQLALERELLERTDEMRLGAGGARYARGFVAPAPQRVRVILFAPSALARGDAELAMPASGSSGPAGSPAGPATSPIAPAALPAEPAAQPAADAGPAEAAPAAPASAPDR